MFFPLMLYLYPSLTLSCLFLLPTILHKSYFFPRTTLTLTQIGVSSSSGLLSHIISILMPKPCPIDKRNGSNNKSKCISLKAWKALEQIIAHQISSKQIGKMIYCVENFQLVRFHQFLEYESNLVTFTRLNYFFYLYQFGYLWFSLLVKYLSVDGLTFFFFIAQVCVFHVTRTLRSF